MIAEKEAEALLEKYAPNKKQLQIVLQHSRAVEQAAMVIAEAIKKNKHKVNLELVRTGALLHDIGRFFAPPHSEDSIKHGLLGAKILRKEGLPKHARIAETHTGAGITREEIIQQKLPLPKKDLLPKTIEEKIITYADKLIFGSRMGEVSEVVARFKKENLPYSALQRLIALHNEIEKLRGGREFVWI